jgi:tetratricopeptide (TPR) repeat protein/transglutaminase-like putative cysteine protease
MTGLLPGLHARFEKCARFHSHGDAVNRIRLSAPAIGAILFVHALAATAHAQNNPYEAELARLAAETSRTGTAPRAIIPLIELWRTADHVPPDVLGAHLDRLSSDRRLSPAVRNYARILRASSRVRRGDMPAHRRELRELGFVQDWRIAGPFDNEGKLGFPREFPPEAGRMGPIDPNAEWPGRERPVGWRTYPVDVTQGGYVSFDAVYRPNANVCGYAETFVESERAQALSLWIGGGGATRVWWNGTVVHEDEGYRTPHPDRSAAVVGAHRGLNRVLVKACATDGAWGFYLRVADARGEAAQGVNVRSSAPAEDVARIAAGHGVPTWPTAPMTPFHALRAAAIAERASAQQLEDFARFLVWTGADDPAERRAREISARAAESQPTVRRLAFAAGQANTRGDAMRFSRRALELSPNDPDALLLSAALTTQGPSPEAALPIIERLPRNSRQWMQGILLAADVLRTIGLPETARARVEDAARLAPRSPAWVAARANAAGGAERTDELVRLREEMLTVRWDDLGSRRTVLEDALNRGEPERAIEQLEIYRALAADRADTHAFAAAIYEALERMDQAYASFRMGLEIAPEDAGLYALHGRMLLREGQRDAASNELRRALALRPQDAPTRELLEQLAPERRPDEAYAAAPEVFLARRAEAGGYSTRILQDLTVNTVFDSGLGSQFRQMAVQIQDAEGARNWRGFPIQFDPDVQRVDVRRARVFRDGRELSSTQTMEQQLGDPAYRMYYDTRQRVVVFPDLEPGDVLEIQYRVDDVAPRNLFHDYYGDLTLLQMTVPTAHREYVLITPASRRFYFNEPNMQGLEHTTREENGRRVDRFSVDDVPALSTEPSMPGMTELVPYLHVSTYRTWEEVGRWYWGLINDQLYADEGLRNRVRELTRGVTDVRTKVARIYDWAIRNTRYVALEFGIHGFLPYRVPDIVSRGFGDCKDTASLIYVMLREAGIDARIVLIRTRRNGNIGESPASLAVFDHAIAYVPELDLYLDGTAELSGIEDMPQMDQGVMVLRVGPDDVTLARTPVREAARNQRVRRVTMQLTEDGSGTVDVVEEIRGNEAPSYRQRYQAEGVREDRLEQQMRSIFPGLELTQSGIANLENFEQPVELRYAGRATQLAVRDGRTLRVAPTVLGDLSRSLATASTRDLPLELGGRSMYVEERRVQLPQGYTIGELPEGGSAESPFGRLSVEVARDGRDVRSRTEFQLNADRVSASDYPAFRRWVEQVDRILRQRVTFAPGGDR